MKINRSSIRLYASAEAVINQYLHLPGPGRIENIVSRVKLLSEDEVENYMIELQKDFSRRHRILEEVLLNNYGRVCKEYKEDISWFSDARKLLLGSFFTKEYSIQSAALFNPSIVPHPDQSGLAPGEQRFIMSLRATGEGHISSVIFKTGTIDNNGRIALDAGSGYFTSLKKNTQKTYSIDFIKERVTLIPNFKKEILDALPESFTANEALSAIGKEYPKDDSEAISVKIIEQVFDTNYELESSVAMPMTEKVIFPSARAESMGMEDVRLVKFTHDNGDTCYYGTYTAYDGHHIKTQLIETKDFDVFDIRTLSGNAISDKGMALFPEKIKGKYVMISRQGGEKMQIMFSENLYRWDDYQLLMEPEFPWEMVQLGNCGSPFKTEKGWVLLTHGVGPMRTYVISAILLDLEDPSKIIGRLDHPLIKADEKEREGYVPNVVYTCGYLPHGSLLFIPYAVSDSATGFVTLDLNELLNEMI
jgi:predicted GH43/DUF377 family glycosyl hydrolase